MLLWGNAMQGKCSCGDGRLRPSAEESKAPSPQKPVLAIRATQVLAAKPKDSNPTAQYPTCPGNRGFRPRIAKINLSAPNQSGIQSSAPPAFRSNRSIPEVINDQKTDSRSLRCLPYSDAWFAFHFSRSRGE